MEKKYCYKCGTQIHNPPWCTDGLCDDCGDSSETCKFPREAAEIKSISGSGIHIKTRKQYPHPHTLSNLKRLANMPLSMLI